MMSLNPLEHLEGDFEVGFLTSVQLLLPCLGFPKIPLRGRWDRAEKFRGPTGRGPLNISELLASLAELGLTS